MLQRLASRAVSWTQQYMPAAYLFALLLTFLAAILAVVITKTALADVAAYWYQGLWEILTFTTQMVLVLLCGHALVEAPSVKRGLDWFTGLPRTERQAGVMVFLVSWAAALLNWGFCLVVAGVLVREVPKRLPTVSKGYLAAAGYAGFGVWASGFSSSIALVSATPGSALNIIEQFAHRTIPLHEMLWQPYNVVPVMAMALLMPMLFWSMHPPSEPTGNPAPDPSHPLSEPPSAGEVSPPAARTVAERIEQSRWITLLLLVMGLGYIFHRLRQGTFSLDLNMMIFLLLLLGWALHGTPLRYMRAFHAGGRAAGPLLLAYPMYGGILGLIRDTGLADWFAQLFVSFSTADSLPFWSYVSSNVITLFVPSGGGHWAVQGPVMVKAAIQLDASLPKTAMAVAFGEQTANMIQPFWALPIVSLGGINIREMMGYCLLVFAIALPLFGLALLVF